MTSRFLPNSFDPETLDIVTVADDWRWIACEDALRRFSSRGVMSRLPLWWQLESPLHAACVTVGAPLFLNDAANMPLGAAAIMHADIDTIVTTGDDAHVFSRFLWERSVTLPRAWFIVHPLRKKPLPDSIARTCTVIEEIQASPGIPYA